MEKDFEGSIEPEEDEIVIKKSTRIIQGVIALLVLSTFFYFANLNQYFFFRKTPESIEQPAIETIVDAVALSLPLEIYLIRGSDFGSTRSLENARHLAQNAESIWQQADINFDIQKLEYLDVTQEEYQEFRDSPHVFVYSKGIYNPNTIRVLLVENLSGINGISYVGIDTVAVADYTTVLDFRTLAHEIGHALSLGHVPGDRGRLMYKGANGTKLSLSEVMYARENAERFSEL